MSYIPTPQQQAVMESIVNGESCAAEAVAGAGKTSTIVEGVKLRKPSTALATSFGKRNVEDLARRMPGWVTCKTLNGLGHSAWGRHSGERPIPSGDKTWDIIKEMNLPFGHGDLVRLVGSAKSCGLVPKGAQMSPKGFYEDTTENWQYLIDTFDYDFSDIEGVDEAQIISWARQILIKSIAMGWKGTIDFDDQLYLPAIYGSPMTKFDLIMNDESQDTSMIQRVLLRRSLAKGGTFIGIGDRHQAIYGFRGAGLDSMQQMINEFSLEVKPLTVSFRCPKAVVKEAQAHVPHIEAHESAPEGLVKHHGYYGHGWEIVDLPAGITVLCRYNAPLLRLAFKLIRNGRGCKVLGTDIGKSLVKTVEKFDRGTIGPTLQRMHDHWQSLFSEGVATPKSNRFKDRLDCIQAIAEEMGDTYPIGEVTRKLAQIFSPSAGGLVLSSIHKAKGLEWPIVALLNPGNMPGDRALSQGGWQLEQENNCAYVGKTRAQEELHYINMRKDD